MREPRKYSVRSLLHGDVQYIIPPYQRGFDWKGDAQVRDLFVDITSCIESAYTDSLFLGTMIFDVSKENEDNSIEVIDGQQRLTTLIIMLIAARDYARDILHDEGIAHSLQAYISNVDALSDTEHHRLLPSATIADVLGKMCEYEWARDFPASLKKNGKAIGVRRQTSRVKPIYDFCLAQIESFCEGGTKRFKQFANQVLQHTFVIRIDIEDRAEAFEIFERTNARGKGLEVSDLLKNFLFSKEKEYSDESITDVWDEIVEGFGENLLRALKYFWISRKGHVTSRDLYRKLRYYAGEIGVSTFIDELRDFSRYYKAYHSDEPDVAKEWLVGQGFPPNDMYLKEFRRCCSMLRLFGVTQVVPFVYSLIRAYKAGEQGEKEAKKVLTMMRTLESFHFVNNKVCNRIGNETEKAYSGFSPVLFRAVGLSETTKVRSWFDEALASADEFAGSLSAVSYHNRTDRITIRYIFDKLVNAGIKDGQRLDLVDIDALQRGIRSSYDIEHLLSQSEANSDEAEEFVHQVGNLIVIPRQINGIMSNAPFDLKMDMLKQPWKYDNNIKNVPSYLQEFVSRYGQKEWTETAIRERNSHLAGAVYEVAATMNAYK